MKPERLKVKNFLGIIDADIDFNGKGVFAILGDNGAGKSSILEAIYFALFGETLRFGGKEKRTAINRHCSERNPKAIIEFTFSNRNGKHRIKRIIHAGKQPTISMLETLSPTPNTYTKDADKEIQKLIQVDKEIFKKTILLPQGEMTGFISSRKAETVKNILTGIFGISTLSEVKKLISQRHSEIKGKYEEKQLRIENLKYIKGKPIEDALNESQKLLKSTMARVEKLKEEVAKLNQIIESTANLLDIQQRIQEKSKQIIQKEEEIKSLQEKVEEDNIIEKVQRIKPYYDILKEKEKRINELREWIKNTLKREEDQKRESEKIARELKSTAEKLNIYESCKADYKRFLELLSIIKTKETNKRQLEAYKQKKEKEIRALTSMLNSLNEKKRKAPYSERELLITRLKENLKVGDRCPICGNIIKDLREHENHVDTDTLKAIMELEANMEKTNQDIQSHREVIISLKTQLDNISADIAKHREEISKLKSKVESATANPIKSFESMLERLNRKQNTYKNSLTKIETSLENSKERLDEYNKTLNTLTLEYKQEAENFKEKLNAIGITEDKFLYYKDKTLTDAKRRVQQLQAEIQQLKSDIEAEKERTGDTRVSIGELREKLKQLREIKDKKELEVEELTRQQGSLKREVQSIYERKKELEELKAQIEDVEKEYILTKKLNHYLESNRFPAYVSDYYLNAIVRRANHILFRFFGGKYILSTESSELKVIDKNLPDTTVSIDSLSGGEKVLVSMSIAMAITELTTNHIDMLFIDEGFSPLDNNNIQEVAREIQLLEGTNKVIGIVTHNQDFAEQFNHILKVENGRTEWQR